MISFTVQDRSLTRIRFPGLSVRICAPEGEPEFAVALVETVMINRDGTDFRGTGTGDEAEREQQDQQDCGQDLIAFHGDSSLRVGGDGFQCFHSV